MLLAGVSLTKVKNDSQDEGCKCQGCGRRYKVDLNVPDDLWKFIRYPDNPNLLCGICIMERIEQIDDFSCFNLVRG